MSAVVEVSRKGPVAILTLNRPETLNALTPGMLRDYVDLLDECDRDPSIRVIIVTGAGRGFCSGADLSLLEAGPEALRSFTSTQSWDSLPLRAFTLATPVVSAINGPAAGIGFVLGLCADRRFITAGTSISATFPRLGLVAEYGIAWLLPRIVGLGPATDLLLTGRPITSSEANEIGLATEVPDAYTAALEWADLIVSSSSPRAIATIKQQLWAAHDQSLPEAAQESLALMSESFGWPDISEVLNARKEGRTPAFPDADG